MALPMTAQWGQPVTRDLSTLADPDLQQIIDVLQQRFHNEHIYTNIGEILVSVNPYHFLPIFGPQVGNSYLHVQSSLRLEPHVFMTACRAHRYLQLHHSDQAVLLSGESGSGKTECVKMLISQLGRMSGTRSGVSTHRESGVANKLSEALNLLDIFGNADTLVNSNASRFGKLVDTYWDGNNLVGAEITCQGLERGRVMLPGSGERNFHVFYRMLAGFDQDTLRRHHLNQSYRVLEPYEGGSMFRDRDDMSFHRENYHYLRDCLKNLNIEQKMFRSGRETAGTALFEVLSAILHLGNIHFAPDPDTDAAFVANVAEVEAAASLMGVHVEDLLSLMLNGSKYSRGERVRYRRDVGGASMTRNALVRYIYQKLFYWLVESINSCLALTGRHRYLSNQLKTIGILDTPGFETMETNSLEQLHHNMAEERLRYNVNYRVFQQEFEDLERNGVRGHRLNFPGNSQVFEVFFNPDMGLLRLIDDSMGSHGNPEAELISTIRRSYSKSPVIKTDNTGKTFMIVHHRGQVIYSVDALLTKNSSPNVQPFQSLLQSCQNPLLQELTSLGQRGRDQGNIEDDDELTATQKYAASLSDLFRRLEGRETQHIWCIRPNMRSESGRFDTECVARQVAAMNLVETAMLRARGYPVRLTLQNFINRYKFIAIPLSARLDSLSGPCNRIIKRAGLPDGGWEVRNKMVFLAWWHQDYLDTALERALHHVVFVQSRLRGLVARRRYRRVKKGKREEKDELSDFFDDVSDLGNRTFYACQTQNDHNTREAERRYTGQDGGRRRPRRHSEASRQNEYYNMYRNGQDGEQYSAFIDSTPDEMSSFAQSVLRDVTSKRDIAPGTWAKIICMEYDRPVGKLYVQNREVTIDGSYKGFDGDRIGLGVFRNPERDRETETIRGHIGQGLCLSRDSDGNIWAKRMTKNEIIVQGYDDPAHHSLSADVIINKGMLPYQRTIKVFDMKELKSRVGLELKSSTFNRERLLHQTILCISLLAEGDTPLDTPCWLCVVNMVALNTLRAPDVMAKVEQMVAQVELKTEEEEEEEEKALEAKQRHLRKQWSKTDQREGLIEKEGSARKIRMALRKKGESIGDHMDYSWNTNGPGGTERKQLTMDVLQNRVSDESQYARDQGLGPTSPTGKSRGWAKVKVAVKSAKAKEEGEMDAAYKSRVNRY